MTEPTSPATLRALADELEAKLVNDWEAIVARHQNKQVSPACTDGDHGWCSNRTLRESHCDCTCHVVKASKGYVEAKRAATALREAAASLETLKQKQIENPPCNRCGGLHPYDTVVPSVEWNEVIRGGGPEIPDYLCIACIVRAFAIANRSFHAELWGDAFNGLPISIHINNKRAQSTQRVQEENNLLRVRLREAERACQELRTKAEAAEALCATLRRQLEEEQEKNLSRVGGK